VVLTAISSPKRNQLHSCSPPLRTRIPRLRSKSKANVQKSAHNAAAKVNESSTESKTVKAKHLSLAIAALLAAGGLWFAWSAWRTPASRKPSLDVGSETPHSQPNPGQMLNPPAHLAPPDPTRRFVDFTPEQRVEFARKGHGPGG
jgi:hypothetical protein